MAFDVIILTLNEEVHIGRAIESVIRNANQVFVIDAGSSDRTVEIAESKGAFVLSNAWTNYAQQFQWALDNAPLNAQWILRLDADEILDPEMSVHLHSLLDGLPSDIAGVTLRYKLIFMNRWIRHGGRYPLTLLRIFRRGQGRIEQRWMDEHIIVEGGGVAHFRGGFTDHNLKDLTFFTEKHNKYATREAVDVLNRRYGLFAHTLNLSARVTSRQAVIKRFVKERIYNRIPFEVATLAYFLYRYVIRL